MSLRKWRETKQHPSRARSGHQIICCLVFLHFLCDILSGRPVKRRRVRPLFFHPICGPNLLIFFPAVVWMDSQLTFLFGHRLEIFLSQTVMGMHLWAWTDFAGRCTRTRMTGRMPNSFFCLIPMFYLLHARWLPRFVKKYFATAGALLHILHSSVQSGNSSRVGGLV